MKCPSWTSCCCSICKPLRTGIQDVEWVIEQFRLRFLHQVFGVGIEAVEDAGVLLVLLSGI